MEYKETISKMKFDNFGAARANAIGVFSYDKRRIGELIPVGNWVLKDESTVEAIRAWRQRSMVMFLTQFDSTFRKTRDYLETLSVGEEGRLLFLLYDDAGRMVGHIGISNVDG